MEHIYKTDNYCTNNRYRYKRPRYCNFEPTLHNDHKWLRRNQRLTQLRARRNTELVIRRTTHETSDFYGNDNDHTLYDTLATHRETQYKSILTPLCSLCSKIHRSSTYVILRVTAKWRAQPNYLCRTTRGANTRTNQVPVPTRVSIYTRPQAMTI